MSISNKFKSITVSNERPVYEKFNITEEQYNIVKEIYDIYSESYDIHIEFINKLKALIDKSGNTETESLTLWFTNSREYMFLKTVLFYSLKSKINNWRKSKCMKSIDCKIYSDIFEKSDTKLSIEEVLELINVNGWWV